MSITFDFKIIRSSISGLSQIEPQNEDAFTYLTDEMKYTIMSNGVAPLFDDEVDSFVTKASWAHLCCDVA